MIFQTKPADFNSKFEIVSCFVEKENLLLLLHRQDHKPQGDTWGIPAGKIDNDEGIIDAIQRELKEETGLEIAKDSIYYIDKVYTRYPEYDFIFHMFRTQVNDDTKVTINPKEHKDYIWINPIEVKKLNLMEDIGECIRKYFSKRS